MPDELKIIDLRLGYVCKALRTTTETAKEHAVRKVAQQHFDLIQHYRTGLRTGQIAMPVGFGDPAFGQMIDLSKRTLVQAERRQWRALLGGSYTLIMALPGEPPSLPKRPPRSPWRKR